MAELSAECLHAPCPQLKLQMPGDFTTCLLSRAPQSSAFSVSGYVTTSFTQDAGTFIPGGGGGGGEVVAASSCLTAKVAAFHWDGGEPGLGLRPIKTLESP